MSEQRGGEFVGEVQFAQPAAVKDLIEILPEPLYALLGMLPFVSMG